MPRGSNPNSRKNLVPFKAGDPKAKEAQRRGGRTTAAQKATYKSLRQIFRQELTEDEAKQIRAVLLTKILAMGDLNALDRFVSILGDSTSAQVNVEAQVGGGVIMMERQDDGEK